jgi:hypothetical protein
MSPQQSIGHYEIICGLARAASATGDLMMIPRTSHWRTYHPVASRTANDSDIVFTKHERNAPVESIDMKPFTTASFLLVVYAAGARSEIVMSSFNASLDTGSLAETSFVVSFSYDSSQVSPVGDSYVQLNSFDFTLLGVAFTRDDIFQGGQAIFRDGTINNVTASFQVILPPNSPVENITFGFGGPGVIAYVDLSGQFGTGSFSFGTVKIHFGIIVSIRRVIASDALGGQPGVEIEVFSADEFPVRDQIMVLQVGAYQFYLSRYPNGDLNTVVFTLTEDEFAGLTCGDPVTVQYGVGPPDEVWQFGPLDKSILDQSCCSTRPARRRPERIKGHWKPLGERGPREC